MIEASACLAPINTPEYVYNCRSRRVVVRAAAVRVGTC